jgi:hypothetical protein
MMAKLYHRSEAIRSTSGDCALHTARLHARNANGRHRDPSMQESGALVKTGLGDNLMESGLLVSSGVPSIPLFIHPLPLTRLHAVDIREMHANNCPGKRLFSTQMDYSMQHVNKRRARGESMGIHETDHIRGTVLCCPQDRDPGPGLLAFSRSPDNGPLFYKRNINPQIGGHA